MTIGTGSLLTDRPTTLSVTDAASRGVSGLVKEAEAGGDVVVVRHGRPVAAVVSVAHLEEIRSLEGNLRSAALVLSRALTDTGNRTDIDKAFTRFGFDRAELEAELEAELDADLAAGLAAGRD